MERLTNSRTKEVRLDATVRQAINKLAEYEDLEEQGGLVKLPCKEAWFLVDRNTEFAMVLPKPIQDLSLYEIKGIDVKGYYWSTREKAEDALRKWKENHK